MMIKIHARRHRSQDRFTSLPAIHGTANDVSYLSRRRAVRAFSSTRGPRFLFSSRVHVSAYCRFFFFFSCVWARHSPQ